MVLIGATCVGSVRLTASRGDRLGKGDEIGYFEFGGSAVATIFAPDRIHLAGDLREQSRQYREVYARMGEVMGEREKPQ